MVLSHGQATVERGFSINKQVETENLSNESVVVNRTMLEGLNMLDATDKKLILAAAAAHRKYSAYE